MSVSATRVSMDALRTAQASVNAAPGRSVPQTSVTAQAALSTTRPGRQAPQMRRAITVAPAAPAIRAVAELRFTTSDGTRYTGEGRNGLPHGKGRMDYSNGDIFVGTFVDGVQQGMGSYTYKNGDVYQGEFANNKMHGRGEYTSAADGSKRVGTYVNGQRQVNSIASLRTHQTLPVAQMTVSNGVVDSYGTIPAGPLV